MAIGSGFVNLENLLALNSNSGKKMRDKVQDVANGGFEQNQAKFLGGLNKQFGADQQARQKLYGSEGGVQDALQGAYGKGQVGYNNAQSNFDAAISGGPIKQAPQYYTNIKSTMDDYGRRGHGVIGGAAPGGAAYNPTQQAVDRAKMGAAQNGKIAPDDGLSGRDAAQAAGDGTYDDWVAAGKPPYAQWKASRGL